MTSVLAIASPVTVRAVDDQRLIESCDLPISALTRQMHQGEDEAWRQFHSQYYLALMRYVASRLGSANDAADVVQQVYLRVGRHIKPFDDEEPFWRWLLCVARCAAADYRRGVRRRATLLEKFAHWRQAQDNEAPSGAPARDGFIGHEALEQLSPEDARILRLKYYEGCTAEEIATLSGATLKAIENRLSRARQRLREIILKTNDEKTI
jgi:RNA polymerase sigma-70 factor (ECF subfamily)